MAYTSHKTPASPARAARPKHLAPKVPSLKLVPSGEPLTRNFLITSPKYDPAFCARVIDLLAEGLSLRSLCGDLGITMKTLDHWKDKYPEFNVACEIAENRAWLFWDKLCAAAPAMGKDCNHVALAINMWNRFGWTQVPGDRRPGGGGAGDEGPTGSRAELTAAEKQYLLDIETARAARLKAGGK